MQEHSNVVLDDTWLNKTAAVMDYGSIQCTVVRIGHKCVLLPLQEAEPTQPAAPQSTSTII